MPGARESMTGRRRIACAVDDCLYRQVMMVDAGSACRTRLDPHHAGGQVNHV